MDKLADNTCDRCGMPLAGDNRDATCGPCLVAYRGQLSAPPVLPTGFWNTPEMREALATRHMGRVIQAYRHHRYHRQVLPQQVVGGWIGVTQGQLSRFENGPTPVHLDRLVQIARVLNLPASSLWFSLPGAQLETSPADRLWSPAVESPILKDIELSRWWASADTVEIVNRFTRGDLVLDRRDIGRALTGVLFGSKLLEPLERWLSGPDETPRKSRKGSVGLREVEQIENAARMFRRWDDQFGGGLKRKAVVGQLNEVADLLRDTHPDNLRRRLFGAMAQLVETSAIMSWDSGHQALAQRYYLLAIRSARNAGDRPFAANVMAGMARQLLYLAHPGDALELIRLAQDSSSGEASSTVRAMLFTREAWAYAKLGRISAFKRATAKAEDAYAMSNPGEDPHWISYFDLAELEGTTGGRLLELAHYDKGLADETAARITRAITLRRPRRLRSSALDHIGLAEVRMVQGELEEAVRLGEEALSLVVQTASDRVRVKLREFYHHSDHHGRVPVVAGFRERIKSMLVQAA